MANFCLKQINVLTLDYKERRKVVVAKMRCVTSRIQTLWEVVISEQRTLKSVFQSLEGQSRAS